MQEESLLTAHKIIGEHGVLQSGSAKAYMNLGTDGAQQQVLLYQGSERPVCMLLFRLPSLVGVRLHVHQRSCMKDGYDWSKSGRRQKASSKANGCLRSLALYSIGMSCRIAMMRT
jgi:hypothetical protein